MPTPFTASLRISHSCSHMQSYKPQNPNYSQPKTNKHINNTHDGSKNHPLGLGVKFGRESACLACWQPWNPPPALHKLPSQHLEDRSRRIESSRLQPGIHETLFHVTDKGGEGEERLQCHSHGELSHLTTHSPRDCPVTHIYTIPVNPHPQVHTNLCKLQVFLKASSHIARPGLNFLVLEYICTIMLDFIWYRGRNPELSTC